MRSSARRLLRLNGRILIAAVALLSIGLGAVAATAGEGGKAAYHEDAVLVAFHPKAPLAARVSAIGRLGLAIDPAVKNPYFARLLIGPHARAAGAGMKSVLAALRRDPAVRVAEPDYIARIAPLPNDPLFPQLYGLHNTGQSGGTPDADIDAPEAWDTVTGSNDVIVAIIDTGIDYNHEDLTDNVLRNGSGSVVGFDFANNDADPLDDNDHGSHVAGTVGARGNNAIGVAGVCQVVKLMPVKVFNAAGNGSLSGILQGIDFARLNGAHVMNNSWALPIFSQLLLEAVQRAESAGILFVAAASNEGVNNDENTWFPANLNQFAGNVLSVAATNRNDQLASFSNFGIDTVDIAAPGVSILSTTRGNTYSLFDGTSMAAPHVSGAAALIRARYPAITLARLKARLLFNVDRPTSLVGKVATGRLNVNNALVDDLVPPGPPTGLDATQAATNALLLSWTASGDDGAAGTSSQYELRYSTSPITGAEFDQATPAPHLIQPGPSGSAQTYLLTGLAPGTNYFLALRAVDNVGNVSALATAGPLATQSATCLLQDDVEGPLQFTGQAPWASTTEQRFSGTHSYTDSPASNYFNNVNASLTQNSALTLTGAAPVLTFWARTDLEQGDSLFAPPGRFFDFLHVEVSGDGGGSWTRVLSLAGTSNWRLYTVPLTAFSGQSVMVRFRLVADSTGTRDGVWLDDIRLCVSNRPQSCALADDVEGTPQFTGAAPWAVTTEDRFSPTHAYADSPGGNYGHLLDISLTQVSAVSLAGFVPVLTFRARTETEPGFDGLAVEVSTDGGSSWRRQPLFLTGVSDWSQYSVSLARYLGQLVEVRFRFLTDISVADDGVWVDDIQICGEQLGGGGGLPPGGRIRTKARVNFRSVTVGANKDRNLVIRNMSRTETLHLGVNAPNPAQFTIVVGGGAGSIPPRGKRTVLLRFAPNAVQEFLGSLVINSGDPLDQTVTVALAGKGK